MPVLSVVSTQQQGWAWSEHCFAITGCVASSEAPVSPFKFPISLTWEPAAWLEWVSTSSAPDGEGQNQCQRWRMLARCYQSWRMGLRLPLHHPALGRVSQAQGAAETQRGLTTEVTQRLWAQGQRLPERD